MPVPPHAYFFRGFIGTMTSLSLRIKASYTAPLVTLISLTTFHRV